MLLKNESLICFLFNLVGLVDTETNEEFIAQLESLKEVWDTRERESSPNQGIQVPWLHFGESYIT